MMIQPLFKHLGWHGFGEQEALQNIAAERLEKTSLRYRLDALGDDAKL